MNIQRAVELSLYTYSAEGALALAEAEMKSGRKATGKEDGVALVRQYVGDIPAAWTLNFYDLVSSDEQPETLACAHRIVAERK